VPFAPPRASEQEKVLRRQRSRPLVTAGCRLRVFSDGAQSARKRREWRHKMPHARHAMQCSPVTMLFAYMVHKKNICHFRAALRLPAPTALHRRYAIAQRPIPQWRCIRCDDAAHRPPADALPLLQTRHARPRHARVGVRYDIARGAGVWRCRCREGGIIRPRRMAWQEMAAAAASCSDTAPEAPPVRR